MKRDNNVCRINQILDSCREDADAQLTVVKEMLKNGVPTDLRALAVMAMAAENTARTMEKYHQLRINRGGHALATSAA